MAKEKLKIAVVGGASCSGCDIAILDTHEKLLDILKSADIVFMQIAVDAKHADLEEIADNEIDVGIYHGSVRSSEQEHLAKLLRRKSKTLIALGACACFGGIFGLANTTSREMILKEVYCNPEFEENAEKVTPQESYTDAAGHKLTLPSLFDEVYALNDKVLVDYFIPLCPPLPEHILSAVSAAAKGKLPPKESIIGGGTRTLCSECPRTKSKTRKIEKIYRPHEIQIDQEKCMLDQGILCMGPATRAGCKVICLNANVPCRGCNGPTHEAIDQGGNILGLFATIFGIKEEELTEEDIKKLFTAIKDPLGTFYRFTLPDSMLRKVRRKK
jgi:F420-non-reducing hydrogenase small subunit